jgi:hypothetical protein
MSEIDELRTLIREVIRDQLAALQPETGSVETVDLSTDADLAAFITRLLDLAPAECDDIRAGRKHFRLASSSPTTSATTSTTSTTPTPGAPDTFPAPPPNVSIAQSIPSERSQTVSIAQSTRSNGVGSGTAGTGSEAAGPGRGAVRRVERGAVTEAMVRDAARAGERLVLGRGAILTPLARDRARASGVEIEKEH